MYRWFLSWRYLTTRATNLIGIGGITVGVGALIMILSIMTGFLEETKKLLRGDLSDLVIKPYAPGRRSPAEPHGLLAALRDDPRIAAATPRLNWFALIAGTAGNPDATSRLLSDSENQGLSGVQIVGVDVLFEEGLTLHALSGWLRLQGLPWAPPRLQDEFDTTLLLQELQREPNPLRASGSPVANPYLPFAPPPGFRPAGRPRASVVVGEALADQLGLRPGSPLQLATFTIDPASGELYQSNRDFVVSGTFRSGENALDLGRVYMDRLELWDFLGRGATYTEVLVDMFDYDRDGADLRAELVDRLQEERLIVPTYPSLTANGQVRTWEDFRSAMLSAVENERVLMGIMLSLVMLVAGFTIFAILTMMVGEKRRDIGILASIGASQRGILWTFLTVGFWNALVGTAFGALFGVLLAININGIEMWLSDVFGVVIFDRNVYAFDRIPAVIQPDAVAIIVAGAFVSTLLFAAIPAWRAARLDPVVALRYE